MRPFWIILLWVGSMLAIIWGGELIRGEAGHEGGGADGGHVSEAAADGVAHGPGQAEGSASGGYESARNNRIGVLTEHGIYPCSQCHNQLITNPKRRDVLPMPHEDIELNHGPVVWCLNCHSAEDRDRLQLLDGTKVSFNETQRLCGECHGPIYRDWKHGVHGLRTGGWRGEQKAWLCVRCHHPHDPAFKPMKPLAPPKTRFDH